MRYLKNPRLITVVLIVAGILAVALWPTAIEVDVSRIERGPMQVTIDEEGETRVRERFVVSAPVAGRLQRIELEPGDTVVRGKTVVARLQPASAPLIDPRTQAELNAALSAANAAVGQARAERDRAATTLMRAQSTLRRQQMLAEAGAIAQDEVEAAETAARTAEEAMRASEFGLARAQDEVRLARARLMPSAGGGRPVDVVAPVDGVVLRRLRESESAVPIGEPLVEIGDPESLEVVADLLSTDAVRVQPDAPVLIDQWGGPHPLEGRVRRVEPSGFMKVSALGVEEQRVNVIVDLPAVSKLGDGYRVEVRIVRWREDGVLKAPLGAVFRRGTGWAVFAVDGQRVSLRPVEIGERNDVEVQIRSGIDEGQTVVMHPPDTLVDGARVAVRSES